MIIDWDASNGGLIIGRIGNADVIGDLSSRAPLETVSIARLSATKKIAANLGAIKKTATQLGGSFY